MILFSNDVLLAYRIATDIYMLILSLDALPNSLLAPVDIGDFLYINMSSANSDDQTLFFLFWVSFFPFFCLISLVLASCTMLNNSGESEHLCLIPDLGEKAFRFSAFSMMPTVGLLYKIFYYFVEIHYFYI